MPYRADLNKDISSAVSVAQGALKTTTTTGTGVDLSGFRSAAVLLLPGAITDGTHTPTIEESDASGSGYSEVAAADLSGTPAALTANTIQEIGYLGRKRYIRVVVTVTGSPSTGGYYGAYVVRGGARSLPQ